MAGAGYKLFQTGDVLTAAQVNTYLNEQTVMVFANAAARTSALTSVLAEGMVSYLQDTNAVEVYNGSAWVGVSGAGDVTEVQAGTGISVASGTGPIPVVTNTMATAIDAKGDLVVGTGADTFSRLAVGGTNGHTLQVDSSTSTGLKWAAAAGGGFVGCRAQKTTNQNTIAQNTWTLVTFNAEAFDTDSFHDNSTNTGRLTIPSGKGGYYRVTASLNSNNLNSGANYLEIYKNGATFTDSIQSSTAYSGDVYNTKIITGTLSLAAGDYIELYFLHQATNTINIEGNAKMTTFECHYLGA